MNSISNMDDVIDSRDVLERISDLENQPELTGDDQTELATLNALVQEAEPYAPDWGYGCTLIRDSYFETYAQELAEDCCPYPRNSPEAKALEAWPYRCIDWEQAALELQMDYTAVEFAGITYWVR